MKLNCPDLKCPSRLNPNLIPGSIVGYGSYYRSSDSKRIKRFRCNLCGRHFSRATLNDCYYQKKRRINFQLYRLLCSGVSQRRSAMLLRVNRKTVERRFRFLASQARTRHEAFLNSYRESKLFQIQFDDLETSEHSKCKPLSVALAVEPHFRKIIGFEVSRMPAKGHLAKISIQKYGHRTDDRPQG